MSSSRKWEHNQVIMSGTVLQPLTMSHSAYGEDFYGTVLSVARRSGLLDRIPILIPGRILGSDMHCLGQRIQSRGQYRSWTQHEQGRNHLILQVFVTELSFLGRSGPAACSRNDIYLDGYVCRDPIYRLTPRGREIAEMLLAVGRAYNKSDYLPCICWGTNARAAQSMKSGAHVRIWGRIQSRIYHKSLLPEDGGSRDYIEKTAYEISVARMECPAAVSS